MFKTALVTGFIRTEGLMRVLEQAQIGGITRFYISIDGPRNESDKTIQAIMIDRIIDFEKKNDVSVYLKQQNANLGLKMAVTSAISWFFEHEKEGFIFEDDLVLSPTFFSFVRASHPKLLSDSKILMISGNQFEDNTGTLSPQLFPYPLIWGWYTTSAKWMTLESLISDEYIGETFPRKLKVKFFWKIGRLKTILGENNSWANPLAGSFVNYGFYCIVPPSNLVSNAGTDIFASHTLQENFENNFSIDEATTMRALSLIESWTYPIQNPNFIESKIYRIGFKHNFLFIKIFPMQVKVLFRNYRLKIRTKGSRNWRK